MPILAGGSLYVTAHTDMYSMDPDTEDVQWYQEPLGAVSSHMMVVDGVAYVSAENWDQQTPETGVVLALDTIRWDALVDQGTVYFASTDGYLYALDATAGELRWRYRTEGAFGSVRSYHKAWRTKDPATTISTPSMLPAASCSGATPGTKLVGPVPSWSRAWCSPPPTRTARHRRLATLP